MPNNGHHDSTDRREGAIELASSIEAYEVDAGTVLYDAGNPLAWIESSEAVSIVDAV